MNVPMDAIAELAAAIRGVQDALAAAEGRREAAQAAQLERHKRLVDELGAIRRQTTETNGRVTALEAERIAREAVAKAAPVIRQEAIDDVRRDIAEDAVKAARSGAGRLVATTIAACCGVAGTAIGLWNVLG